MKVSRNGERSVVVCLGATCSGCEVSWSEIPLVKMTASLKFDFGFGLQDWDRGLVEIAAELENVFRGDFLVAALSTSDSA